MSYWITVVSRNAASQLPGTLNSLFRQTLKPEKVVVVDDGSTDDTPEILKRYKRIHESMVISLRLPDKGYDIRRVPSNINLACKAAVAAGLRTDFFMISGDDCLYPPKYARGLTNRMKANKRIVVASGRPSSGGELSREHSPSGSGRMISSQFWRQVGARYPVNAGWETWLLYKASEMGLQAKLFGNLVFEHIRPRGAKHQFLYWGAAMAALGYNPLYAIGRIAKNTMARAVGVKGSLNMLRGYLQAQLGSEDSFISPFDPTLRSHVSRQQVRMIADIVTSLPWVWSVWELVD